MKDKCINYVMFLFFKQKTAYDMRISDWSSDVCSSDLIVESAGNIVFSIKKKLTPHFGVQTPYLAAVVKGTTFSVTVDGTGASVQVVEGAVEVSTLDGGARDLIRSEEHTSELQSLMRSSYAVFCLTKNTTPTPTPT